MKVLFCGDVVGKPGLRALKELLPRLIGRHSLDLVIANGENTANGAGVTPETAEQMLASEVNLITSGNHIWNKREIQPYLDAHPDKLLRPANYPKGAPGKGAAIVRTPDGRKLGVVNLEGRVHMKDLDDPFRVGMELVEMLRKETLCIFVDMHCEATSEKNAMGAYLDGKVSAVVGSHTHVQTADERILPGGTAFLTDAGMCGPLDSVIGVRKEIVIERFLTQRPNQFETAKNLVYLQGAVIDIDDATGKARSIERVRERLPDT
jgi:metallophosphoesterase (TIGR00282 family)